MIITVKVKPGSRVDSIEIGEEIIVRIKERPIEGKANAYLLKFLSKQLKIPKSSIEIISGESSSIKRISIPLTLEEFRSRV